jgi:hypothetical protein
MKTARRREYHFMICALLQLSLTACGGGGGGGSGDGSGMASGSSKAGLWVGNGCCYRFDPFPVVGMTDEKGTSRFILLSRHYVGTIGGHQTAYSTCGSCLAGPLADDPYWFQLGPVTPGVSVSGKVTTPGGAGQNPLTSKFGVPFAAVFKQPSSLSDIDDLYTTNFDTGYALTFEIEVTGQLFGTDTNGCVLSGHVLANHPDEDLYDVDLDVSSCGDKNGKYIGNAVALFDESGNKRNRLFLSVSNPAAAIGLTLDRVFF